MGNTHRMGFIEVDGVRYHITRCLDHKHCSMTERKTGYKVEQALEGYAAFKKIYSDGAHEKIEQISLFE